MILLIMHIGDSQCNRLLTSILMKFSVLHNVPFSFFVLLYSALHSESFSPSHFTIYMLHLYVPQLNTLHFHMFINLCNLDGSLKQ